MGPDVQFADIWLGCGIGYRGGMGLRVRDATSTDAPLIADFNARLARETEGHDLDPTVVLAGVNRGLSRSELCRYFVAELGDQVVGQTMITYELTDWRDGLLWWIQSVYVLENARERGVFGALYRHIERTAREDPDARGLRLYVDRENLRAMRVYERLGMDRSRYHLYEVDFGADS
jgi:GNAT superfamily N-acetyltransferase